MKHDEAGAPGAAATLIADFSLEMTGKDIPALEEARSVIPAGTRINVTFLANEDLDMRVAAAQAVLERGFVPVPHISARRLTSAEELRVFLARLRDVGATRHVFVVGGDPAHPAGPYSDSLAVIESGILEEYGVEEVSIAGYPEGHPDIPDETLMRFLMDKNKVLTDRGLGVVVLTQFGFDSDAIVAWVERIRQSGVAATIRIGAPGPTSVKRLVGYARRMGVRTNATIVRKYGFSLTNLVGRAGPEKLIDDLAVRLGALDSAGDVKIHFYAFGGMLATAEWIKAYGSRAQ